MRVLGPIAALALTASAGARADNIDFESGYTELNTVAAVATASNTATFTLSSGADPFIAQVGDPRVAFGPSDTPVGGAPGSFFLTSGSGMAADYLIAFDAPIASLTLDVYDFGGDASSTPGDTVTLTLFADADRTLPVGSDTYTIPSGSLPDGNAVFLAVASVSLPALAASVTFTTTFPDTGNGIDNLVFAPAQKSCPGDITGDDAVDFSDLNTLLVAFGDTGKNLPADIDGDGAVGFSDLNAVLTFFGSDCAARSH